MLEDTNKPDASTQDILDKLSALYDLVKGGCRRAYESGFEDAAKDGAWRYRALSAEGKLRAALLDLKAVRQELMDIKETIRDKDDQAN